ncbi:uncharacterized protein LOC142578269 [Dermacentor variabilis]|uniref:uncharacterized protein LOC142578269 n=1 Tax=Dermacentor variabilis TaxID=34621 RepID=UPI003F5C1FF6
MRSGAFLAGIIIIIKKRRSGASWARALASERKFDGLQATHRSPCTASLWPPPVNVTKMSVASFLKIVVGSETTTTNSHNTYNATCGAADRQGRGEKIPFIMLLSLVLGALCCFGLVFLVRKAGFRQEGITAGSVAAWLQSMMGAVPPNSLFSRLQRIGTHGIAISDCLWFSNLIYSIILTFFY